MSLVDALIWRLRLRRLVRGVAILMVLLLLGGGAEFAFHKRLAAQAAALATAALEVREALIAIDSAFVRNDPDRFLGLVHFRNQDDERFKPVLADYIRAESAFRKEMWRTFRVQQRTFDITFRELCVGQPPVRTPFIGLKQAQTNVFVAQYPMHLIQAGETWKWDLFGGLSIEARDQRMAVLAARTRVLADIAREVKSGAVTNLTTALERVQNSNR